MNTGNRGGQRELDGREEASPSLGESHWTGMETDMCDSHQRHKNTSLLCGGTLMAKHPAPQCQLSLGRKEQLGFYNNCSCLRKKSSIFSDVAQFLFIANFRIRVEFSYCKG